MAKYALTMRQRTVKFLKHLIARSESSSLNSQLNSRQAMRDTFDPWLNVSNHEDDCRCESCRWGA